MLLQRHLFQVADGAASAEAGGSGDGKIASLFTKIEGFLSEDIVKSTGAVYQFEVTGAWVVTFGWCSRWEYDLSCLKKRMYHEYNEKANAGMKQTFLVLKIWWQLICIECSAANVFCTI